MEQRRRSRQNRRNRQNQSDAKNSNTAPRGGQPQNQQQGQERTRPSGFSQNRRPIEKPVLQTFICPRCSEPIADLSAALADKATGAPVHFDCVLEFLKNTEQLAADEKLTYIGQGRFAAIFFDNPHDLRHFSIRRIIEWEEHDKKYDWRNEIAGLYSQIK